MSTVTRIFHCSPEDVFAVLADGWTYASWVVGAARIRDVDAHWPAPGSTIHHSVGAWPALIDDRTTVRECEAPHVIELEVRAWPTGQGVVRVTCTPEGSDTVVTMEEDATRGPATFVPKPVREAALRVRNTESLRRLALMAENGARRPGRVTGGVTGGVTDGVTDGVARASADPSDPPQRADEPANPA
jgi:uncharacterized protein YndB with AHSA1/START domain